MFRGLRYISALIMALLLPVYAASASDAGDGGALDMNAYIMGHVSDAYEWHITTVAGREISIPLPCIVIDGGLHVFRSDRMEQHGYTLGGDGRIVSAATGERPLDISITKNVVGLIFSGILLVVLILLCSSWYRTHDILKEKPSGLAALLEPVIVMIDDGVIKEAVGAEHEKFAPYLLTAFFFILINNLMGIVPVFPGGANITGNIAVTAVLALFTFLTVNLFGNRHYYKEIFWPDVPLFLKIIPLMPAIEIVGTLTKPFSLMVRLFANMLAGHIMLLSAIGVIFLTASMGPVINGSLTFVSFLFGVFLDCLELLVAFIQAYVFTMLSAVFIGLAHQHSESETH